ncbi:MAG: hypothetical protein NTW25_03765 [Candidatus Kapabacteria bacterium]|nr:hypothetical protein [Candidatus Kapabacteria bacterium]
MLIKFIEKAIEPEKCKKDMIDKLKGNSYYEILREENQIDLTIKIWDLKQTIEDIFKNTKKKEPIHQIFVEVKIKSLPSISQLIEYYLKNDRILNEKVKNDGTSKYDVCSDKFVLLTLMDLTDAIKNKINLISSKSTNCNERETIIGNEINSSYSKETDRTFLLNKVKSIIIDWKHLTLSDYFDSLSFDDCIIDKIDYENGILIDYKEFIKTLKESLNKEFHSYLPPSTFGSRNFLINFDAYNSIRIGDLFQKYYSSLLVDYFIDKVNIGSCTSNCLIYDDNWKFTPDDNWHISSSYSNSTFNISIFRKIDENWYFGIQIQSNQFRIFVENNVIKKDKIKDAIECKTTKKILSFINLDSMWIDSSCFKTPFSFFKISPHNLDSPSPPPIPFALLNYNKKGKGNPSLNSFAPGHVYEYFKIDDLATIVDLKNNIEILIKHANLNISQIKSDLKLIK